MIGRQKKSNIRDLQQIKTETNSIKEKGKKRKKKTQKQPMENRDKNIIN